MNESSKSESTEASNKKTVLALYEEAINAAKPERFADFVSEDYAGPQGTRGPRGFSGIIDELRVAFPDVHYAVEDVVAEGDRVVLRWTWTGTHRASFRAFAPTGKRFSNGGIVIFRLRDGKIIEGTTMTDRLGFLEQIGAVAPGLVGQPAKR